MNLLNEFELPIKGLLSGTHEFRFSLGNAFFSAFEDSPIQEGQFEAVLKYHRLSDFIELHFTFEGWVQTECDRCLVGIRLPYSGEEEVTVKITEEELEDEADVIYISSEASFLNVAPLLHEFICLYMPSQKVYDCASEKPRPCDMELLKHLKYDDELALNDEKGETPSPENDQPQQWKSALEQLLRDETDLTS